MSVVKIDSELSNISGVPIQTLETFCSNAWKQLFNFDFFEGLQNVKGVQMNHGIPIAVPIKTSIESRFHTLLIVTRVFNSLASTPLFPCFPPA